MAHYHIIKIVVMPTSAHCSCAPGAVNPVMTTRVIVGMALGYVGQTSNKIQGFRMAEKNMVHV